MAPTTPVDAARAFREGRQWSDRTARLALPILLASAKSHQTITYKRLAHKLNELHGEPLPKSFRNYGWPPGKVGDALENLSHTWKSRIPPLSAIVVNEQTGYPGPGAFSFIQRYFQGSGTSLQKDEAAYVDAALGLIFNYPKWDDVADYFGVKIESQHYDHHREQPISIPAPSRYVGGPESEQHKALKKWVSQHPELFAPTFRGFGTGDCEIDIASGDRLDVYFSNQQSLLAAEVKASNAPPSEYFRGIFQCIKYRAVLQATQLAEGKIPNAQAVLVTQHSLPEEAVRLAERLQVMAFLAP